MSDYERVVPMAGAAAVGGLVLSQLYLVAIAAALVLAGALAIRLLWRRNKTPWDRS